MAKNSEVLPIQIETVSVRRKTVASLHFYLLHVLPVSVPEQYESRITTRRYNREISDDRGIHGYVIPGNRKEPTIIEIDVLDPNLPFPSSDPKGKKRRGDGEPVHSANPILTIDKPEMKHIHCNFMCCVNCWDLLNSAEHLQRGKVSFGSSVSIHHFEF